MEETVGTEQKNPTTVGLHTTGGPHTTVGPSVR